MLQIDFAAIANWADAFQGIGTVAGAVISLLGFVFVIRQLRHNRMAIEAQTEAHIYGMGLEAYKVMIEHPELGPYIYEGQPLPAYGRERYQAFSAFEMFCDYFEFIILQEDSVSADVRDSWIRYMTKLFQSSVALQEFIYTRQEQYTPQFLATYQKAIDAMAESGAEPTADPAADPAPNPVHHGPGAA